MQIMVGRTRQRKRDIAAKQVVTVLAATVCLHPDNKRRWQDAGGKV